MSEQLADQLDSRRFRDDRGLWRKGQPEDANRFLRNAIEFTEHDFGKMLILETVDSLSGLDQFRLHAVLLGQGHVGVGIAGKAGTSKAQAAAEVVRRYPAVGANGPGDGVHVGPRYPFAEIGYRVSKSDFGGDVGVQTNLRQLRAD